VLAAGGSRQTALSLGPNQDEQAQLKATQKAAMRGANLWPTAAIWFVSQLGDPTQTTFISNSQPS